MASRERDFRPSPGYVLTMAAGEQTDVHRYGLAEQAVPALQSEGEVWARGECVRLLPGDIAFFAPPVEHAVRTPVDGPGLVAVAAFWPPEPCG